MNNMLKKSIALFTSTLLLTVLISCDGGSGSSETEESKKRGVALTSIANKTFAVTTKGATGTFLAHGEEGSSVFEFKNNNTYTITVGSSTSAAAGYIYAAQTDPAYRGIVTVTGGKFVFDFDDSTSGSIVSEGFVGGRLNGSFVVR